MRCCGCLLLQTLLSCHPEGIDSHVPLRIPCALSPEAASLLKQVGGLYLALAPVLCCYGNACPLLSALPAAPGEPSGAAWLWAGWSRGAESTSFLHRQSSLDSPTPSNQHINYICILCTVVCVYMLYCVSPRADSFTRKFQNLHPPFPPGTPQAVWVCVCG